MELRKKILLIYAPSGAYIREDRCQTPVEDLRTVALRPPIDLLYIAAAMEQADCLCQIVDYPLENKSWDDLKEDIDNISPDILVISATTPSLSKDMMAVDIAKKLKPHILTIAKGAHFNILDVDTLERFPNLDLVSRGEYELTFKDIGEGKSLSDIKGITFRNTNGTIVRNPDREYADDLDAIPFPARHLIDNTKYIRPDNEQPQTTIVTNRGCPFECIFCLSGQVSGLKNRMRSVANIIAEIEECVQKHNIKNFLFRSDLFTANKKWVSDLCNEIIKRNLPIEWACNSRVDTIDDELLALMKKANCWMIAFGVETGNPEMLKKIGKKTDLDKALIAIKMAKKAGIRSSIYFLIGLPWDNETTLQDNINFAKKASPDIVEFFYVYPFPGTQLYQTAQDEGLLKPNEIPLEAYSQPAMNTLFMTKDQLISWRNKSLKAYYLRPSVVFRTLFHARSLKELKNYIKFGCYQLADFFKKPRGKK